MDCEAIFDEIYRELCSEEILHNWTEISRENHPKNQAAIQKIVRRVCCEGLDYYIAGKEVEKLNPHQNLANFRIFLLKFHALFENLSKNEKNSINCIFLLKMVAENSKNPENFIDFSKITSISLLLQRSVNILLKELLENAANLYPNDINTKKTRKITIQDILDGVVLSDNPNSLKFQDSAFLRLKSKLQNLSGDRISTAERRILNEECALYGQF